MAFTWSGIRYKTRGQYMKARWADKEQRAKQMAGIIPAAKIRCGETRTLGPVHGKKLKAYWSKPSNKARLKRIRRAQFNDPTVRRAMSVGQKKAWQGEKGKHRRSRASKCQRAYMLGLPKLERDRRTQERVAGARKVLPQLWKDPEWRAKQLAIREASNRQPAVRKRRSSAMKQVWQRPSYRAKVMATRQRTMYTNPVWKAKQGQCHKGITSWNAGHTKETHPGLMKISRTLTGRIPQQNRVIWLYRKGSICIPMKSSYELLFARWCDERGIEWQYEPRWFNIGKGNWRGISYTPDFYLPYLKAYVELKGWFSTENQRKMNAFYRKYPSISLYFLQYKALRALRVTREHIPHRKPIFQRVKGLAA